MAGVGCLLDDRNCDILLFVKARSNLVLHFASSTSSLGVPSHLGGEITNGKHCRV
jgi:hypothetical protein